MELERGRDPYSMCSGCPHVQLCRPVAVSIESKKMKYRICDDTVSVALWSKELNVIETNGVFYIQNIFCACSFDKISHSISDNS